MCVGEEPASVENSVLKEFIDSQASQIESTGKGSATDR